jgi:hypothetical protein
MHVALKITRLVCSICGETNYRRHKKENNFYSVVAKTTTFLPTNSKLTYQHETKKKHKKCKCRQKHRIILHPSVFRKKKKKIKNQKSFSQPLPHAATPDLELGGNSAAPKFEGED